MPSENDLEFELLLEALENYQAAKANHDKVRGDYDGYSWGYAGADVIENLERARSNFRECLHNIIKAEVAALVQSPTLSPPSARDSSPPSAR